MCGYTPFGTGLFFAVGISFGNILFENAFPIKFDASSNNAYRFLITEYVLDPKDHKCLNSNCLTYI